MANPPAYDRADEWSFERDEANEAELADHRIRPFEAEEVFLNGPHWRRNRTDAAGDYLMEGRTDSGRLLTVVVRIRAGRIVRPITGW